MNTFLCTKWYFDDCKLQWLESMSWTVRNRTKSPPELSTQSHHRQSRLFSWKSGPVHNVLKSTHSYNQWSQKSNASFISIRTHHPPPFKSSPPLRMLSRETFNFWSRDQAESEHAHMYTSMVSSRFTMVSRAAG